MRIFRSIVLSVLLGCGGAGAARPAREPIARDQAPVGPVDARGGTAVQARVGGAGGTLALANGARLAIPAGALAEEVEIDFANAPSSRAFDDEGQRALGPVLNVTPPIAARSGAFELSIPQQALPGGYSEEDLAFAVETAHEGARAIDTLATETRWQFLPVVIEGGRFVARTDGLPGHRVQFGVAR